MITNKGYWPIATSTRGKRGFGQRYGKMAGARFFKREEPIDTTQQKYKGKFKKKGNIFYFLPNDWGAGLTFFVSQTK